MISNNKKTITIYSLKLAGYLMQSGFILIGMSKNKIDMNKFVYFFNNSYNIRSEIENYKQMKK